MPRLAYTGVPRESGINNWEVVKAYVDGDKKVHRNFDRITEIAVSMKRALEKQSWTEVARLLREEWSHRKKNAPGISTPLIDELVEVTRRAGASGASFWVWQSIDDEQWNALSSFPWPLATPIPRRAGA